MISTIMLHRSGGRGGKARSSSAISSNIIEIPEKFGTIFHRNNNNSHCIIIQFVIGSDF